APSACSPSKSALRANTAPSNVALPTDRQPAKRASSSNRAPAKEDAASVAAPAKAIAAKKRVRTAEMSSAKRAAEKSAFPVNAASSKVQRFSARMRAKIPGPPKVAPTNDERPRNTAPARRAPAAKVQPSKPASPPTSS